MIYYSHYIIIIFFLREQRILSKIILAHCFPNKQGYAIGEAERISGWVGKKWINRFFCVYVFNGNIHTPAFPCADQGVLRFDLAILPYQQKNSQNQGIHSHGWGFSFINSKQEIKVQDAFDQRHFIKLNRPSADVWENSTVTGFALRVMWLDSNISISNVFINIKR